jgi:hypothetical protein
MIKKPINKIMSVIRAPIIKIISKKKVFCILFFNNKDNPSPVITPIILVKTLRIKNKIIPVMLRPYAFLVGKSLNLSKQNKISAPSINEKINSIAT